MCAVAILVTFFVGLIAGLAIADVTRWLAEAKRR